MFGKNVKNGSFGSSHWKKEGPKKYVPHVALPVDLKTGKPKEDGHLLGPKDIWAGMEPVFGMPMERHFDASAKPIKFL